MKIKLGNGLSTGFAKSGQIKKIIQLKAQDSSISTTTKRIMENAYWYYQNIFSDVQKSSATVNDYLLKKQLY